MKRHDLELTVGAVMIFAAGVLTVVDANRGVSIAALVIGVLLVIVSFSQGEAT